MLSYITVHTTINAQQVSEKNIVYTFELKQEINSSAWRLVDNCFNEAEKINADIIIIQLNTYGGELSNADLIRTRILKSQIPVYVFIEGNAASAGALISIACDKIFMKTGSTIGAASVVNENGEIMPDKYQSYMRGMMRATAEQRGRDPKIAEGMVSSNNYLPEIADSGRVITLTTVEAIQHHYCDGQVNDIKEILSLCSVTNYDLKSYEPGVIDAIIAFLLNPIVNGILLMLIIGAIYYEFQHPGFGIPILMGLVAAVLYFAPLYLDGLAANWEILIFIVGLIFLMVEIFFIPGFGVAGAIGIICMVTSLTLAVIANDYFDFSYSGTDGILYSLLRVLLMLIVGVTGAAFLARKFLNTKTAERNVVLTDTLANTTSFTESVSDLNSLIGKTGIAKTNLRPSGNIELEGKQYDSISDGEFILINHIVKVVEIRGNYLVVRKN